MWSRTSVVFALALVVLVTAGATPVGATPAGNDSDASVHAVYPDPVASGDTGEFVVVDVPSGRDPAEYALTDGHTTAEFPASAANATGRLTVTTDPKRVRSLTDGRVFGLDGSLALANGGDTVRLRRDGETVDSLRYEESTEGSVGVARGSVIRWRPLGATDRTVVSDDGGQVRAFTLPDAPDAPLEPVRAADDRIFLAGYTLSSRRVADALVAASRRGAAVRILLEGEPVGGRSRGEARTLDRLADADVELRVLAGPHARYRYHHAKYVVADDRAVVLTENWKPAGTGGNGSRGWGVETDQPRIVAGLSETFRADAGWRDAVRWEQFRRGRRFDRGERATASYPSRFEPQSVAVDRTDLLVTPDNARETLLSQLDAAEDSVAVVQPTVGDWDDPLVASLRRAGRRGVEVRLLLSDAWYVREENERTVERFDQWADRTGAPLSARLADPGDRYGKIHAKGAVIDDDAVVVGSLNWNEAAATTNREVLLLLHGSDVADYYGRVFDADWRGGRPQLPLGLVGAVAGVAAVAGLAARRVRFDDR